MKVLIVDDHALFREGLCYVLADLNEKINILQASNCDHALQLAAQHPDLDLVLLDLNMPDNDGFSILNTFTDHYPATLVVIVSASNQYSDMQRALDAGAVGFIPKDTQREVMISALRLVMSGGVYMPLNMAQPQVKSVSHLSVLTARQNEVLALLVQGESNKIIGKQLGLAEATIKMHVTSILKALGVRSRAQAVVAARKLGSVTD